MQTVKITTSQNIEIEYAVAGLGERAVARMIDYGLFMGVYMVCLYSFLGISAATGGSEKALGTGVVVVIIVWLSLYLFYDLIAEIFFNGQSLGKRAMKIKVVSLNGARPTVGQYILRWLFRLGDFGITAGSLAVVSVAMSDNKQRTGDMVAGTTLIKTKPVSAYNDLVFTEPEEGYVPTYPEVKQLTDKDIALVHEVIRYFNATRNNMMVYRLSLRLKKVLNVTYANEINDYQFLEIILKDYTALTSGYDL